ncbi:MAG: type II toxin-antitoxin system HipA family toxin [Xanthomonadales bacterium]|nr:type II toxin-antitoxin system HipA family toxin [Xanthomonadales bacterium]
MKDDLRVLYNGEEMGWLTRKRRGPGGLRFRYSDSWQERPVPTPLSLGMPVDDQVHAGDHLENWLWGLLPDDEQVLRRWAQAEQVAANDLFGLLYHFGEDVAGAVQFLDPDREGDAGGDDIRWLSDADIAERIKALQRDHSQARHSDDPGRFSLAGMQAKTALYRDGDRWGVPSGATPTNVIVKLAEAQEGQVINEHFCLQLAQAMGLPAPDTRVLTADGVQAIAVDRYDRVWSDDGTVERIHQEDICQALGFHPHQRYQNDGGPGVRDIFKLLSLHASEPDEDAAIFYHAQLFNYLVGGTDAHAKNFSVILGPGRHVALAPLYDIASLLPYADVKAMKLAMKIGTSYDWTATLPRHWVRLARETGCVGNPLDVIEGMAEELRETVAVTGDQCRENRLDHPIIPQLVEGIQAMCDCMLMDLKKHSGSRG